MTIPTFVDASTGSTDAGGAWTHTCQAPGAAGRLMLVQIVQDGTTNINADMLNTLAGTNITSILGVANEWDKIQGTTGSGNSLGSPVTGVNRVYVGRSTSTSAPTISGGNGSTDDLYFRCYQFLDASTGATLNTVFENNTADFSSGSGYPAGASQQATSATVTAPDVITLGVDRLALNFVGITDDNPLAAFSGTTGGTWTIRASYATPTGTDAALYLVDAPMTAAGTITGGTASITDSDGWGTIGFAIIGTTIEGNPPYQDRIYRQILPQ